MKLNLNQTLKTLGAAVLLLGTAGMAQAAGPVSDIATATADLTFASNGTASMSITPRTDLMAGRYTGNEVVANFIAKTTAGTVAFRMTPGTGEFIHNDNSAPIIRIKGKNNAENILYTIILSSSITPEHFVEKDNGWLRSSTNSNLITGSLRVQGASNVTVAPDTYVVSMDAASWAE